MAKEDTRAVHVIAEPVTIANMIVIALASLSLWGISREMGWFYNLGTFFLWVFILFSLSNCYFTLTRINIKRKVELYGVWSITLWGIIIFITLIMFGHVIKALLLIPWLFIRTCLTLIHFYQEHNK